MNKWYSQIVKIEWDFDRCIICQKKPVPPNIKTEEHVIPAALSGKLRSDFLCKTCNDKLGKKVDHTACSDLEIRRSAFEMLNMPQDRLTKINQRLNQRQRFVIRTPGQPDVEAVANGDLIQPVTFMNAEGRLMQPSELTIKELRRFMLKQGKTEKDIQEATEKFKAGPVGKDVEPTPGFVTKKRGFENATIYVKGSPVRSLLMLKIAYEFLALIIGPKIYEPNPSLDAIRKYLENLDDEYPFIKKFPLPDKYRIHGIAVEATKPFVSFQVRLFGSMAYRVNFPGYTVAIRRWAYTHDLGNGVDWTVDRDIADPPSA
jgi:hypothetical protein